MRAGFTLLFYLAPLAGSTPAHGPERRAGNMVRAGFTLFFYLAPLEGSTPAHGPERRAGNMVRAGFEPAKA